MKAIQYERFGGPDVLEVVDLPQPAAGDGEVLIAVTAAGVGPGDCKTRAGQLSAHHATTFPKIPGRNGAGVVTAVGMGVSMIRVGDKVSFFARHTEPGTCAEYVVRPEHVVAKLPPGLRCIEAAALVQPALCAWIALCEHAKLKPGMNVLIHGGAGGVGGQAVQLAAHLGAQVTATARSMDIDFVQQLGAHSVIAYDVEDFARGEQQYDVVFDTLGGDVHRKSYNVLKTGGLLICLNADPIEDRSAEYGVRMEIANIEDSRDRSDAILALAGAGVLRAQVAAVLPLSDCAEAHALIEHRLNRRGRVVLQMALDA